MIKRYDIDPRPGHFDLVRDDDGYYVRYADIAHLLEEKTLEQHMEEFEVWAQREGLSIAISLVNDDFYANLDTIKAWQAWKAARGVTE